MVPATAAVGPVALSTNVSFVVAVSLAVFGVFLVLLLAFLSWNGVI